MILRIYGSLVHHLVFLHHRSLYIQQLTLVCDESPVGLRAE